MGSQPNEYLGINSVQFSFFSDRSMFGFIYSMETIDYFTCLFWKSVQNSEGIDARVYCHPLWTVKTVSLRLFLRWTW